MADKIKTNLEDLEQRAIAAARSKKGCEGTQRVTIIAQDRDAIGRNFIASAFEPKITDPDASFRAYQAIGELADKYDLA